MFVNSTRSGVLPVDDTCGLDPFRVLEVVSDELVVCTSEGRPTASQSVVHQKLLPGGQTHWRTFALPVGCR